MGEELYNAEGPSLNPFSVTAVISYENIIILTYHSFLTSDRFIIVFTITSQAQTDAVYAR